MLFQEIVYGPIHSRRLGISLGMNLMPIHEKLCTFDCVYCECGFNTPVTHPQLPSREEIRQALEIKLQTMQAQHRNEGEQSDDYLDVITFSGNGEPTLHPDFEGIIADTCALRNQYCPHAKVSVLSNSTQLGRADVVRALKMCDNRILKLDSALDTTMRLIDRPNNHELTVAQVMQWLGQFEGDFILQTCFLRGNVPSFEVKTNDTIAYVAIDNTTKQEVEAWYAMVRQLRPKQVMIYVIDRATPVKTLSKIPREQMEAIAAPLREEGFDVFVSA